MEIIEKPCSSSEERLSAVSINRHWRATMFNKLRKEPEPMPPLPREIQTPATIPDEQLMGRPPVNPAFIPPKHRANNNRETLASEFAATFEKLEIDLTAAQDTLDATRNDIRQKDAEIARLQMEVAQAKNDVASATTITADAVHAARDFSNLFANIKAVVDTFEANAAAMIINIKAMVDTFETGAPVTVSTARKKRKNGDHPVQPVQPLPPNPPPLEYTESVEPNKE
jgi:hypothetical protein